jgi:RimJ/RimL family protein N-acetyltransferase
MDHHVEVRGGVQHSSSALPPIGRTGRWTRLTNPDGDGVMKSLYTLATLQPQDFRWRFSSTVPSVERFSASLLQRLTLPLVIRERVDDRPIGLVSLYNHRPDSGVSYMGVVIEDRLKMSGIAVEAARLYLRYVLAKWNLRKIYWEVPEWSLAAVQNHLGSVLIEEGRLSDHFYDRGRLWDLYIVAWQPQQ